MPNPASQSWHRPAWPSAPPQGSPQRRRQPGPNWGVVVLYVLTIAGFPLVSVLPLVLHVGSRTVTVPYRALVVAVALAVLGLSLLRRGRFAMSPVLPVAVWLWVLLIVSMERSVWGTGVMPLETSREWYLKGIGTAFIPMLAAFHRPSEATLSWAGRVAFWAALTATLLVAYFAVWVNPLYSVIGRLSTDILDPISFGHLCVALVILAIWAFPAPIAPPRGALSLLRLVAVVLAIALIGATVARQAVLSLIVCAGVLAFTQKSAKLRLLSLVIPLVALGASSLLTASLEDAAGLRVTARWQELPQLGEVVERTSSAGLRVQLWADAWQQFLESPATGGDIVVRTLGMYPHNVVLETLMATGCIGGLCLAFLVYRSARSALRLLRPGGQHRWVGFLYIQTLSASLVSGALFLDPGFWFWLAAVAAITDTGGRARGRPRFISPHPRLTTSFAQGSSRRTGPSAPLEAIQARGVPPGASDCPEPDASDTASRPGSEGDRPCG